MPTRKRNYDRIVEVAREVFREQGYDASLDEVAKRAGVGPGTLYRHFPKRENLLDAIMQVWVDRVERGRREGARLRGAAARPAAELVRGVRPADQPAQGRAGQDHLRDGRPRLADPAPSARCCAAADDRVVDRAPRADGALRDDVDDAPDLRLVGGVATVADQADLDEAAVRPLLEVVADGLLR